MLEVMPVPAEPETEGVHLPVEDPVVKPVPAPRKKRQGTVKSDVPCPVVRRTPRTNAGVHSNPDRLRSLCAMQYLSVLMCFPKCLLEWFFIPPGNFKEDKMISISSHRGR